MRHIFSKYGGNLAETGAVSTYAFDYAGVVRVRSGDIVDRDAFEERVIESGADDIREDETEIQVLTAPDALMSVVANLQDAGYASIEYSLEYISKIPVDVTDFDTVLKILTILEKLEEDEDVESVWSNAEISDSLLERAHAALEAQTFRT